MTADGAGMRLILPLLLLCVALRGFIPAGWMPSVDQTGMSLIPCSGFTPPQPERSAHSGHDIHAMHHGDAAPRHHDGKAKHDMAGQPCAFAAAAADLPRPDFGAAFKPLAPAEPIFIPLLAVQIGRGLAAPPPPQTGPPLTA
jgi:hypothetical protein